MADKNQKIEKFIQDNNVGIMSEMMDIEQLLEDLVDLLKDIDLRDVDAIKGEKGDSIKGDKGDPGENGESIQGEQGPAPTREELLALITPLIPEPIQGMDGKDADFDAIVEAVVGAIPQVDPQEVADIVEKNLPTSGEAIRDSLELLVEGDKLRTSAVENEKGRGLDDILDDLKERIKRVPQRVVTGTQRMFVAEEDGSPEVQTNRIKFTNGSVTSNPDGSASIDLNATAQTYTARLTDQTDGATKVFTVPEHSRVINVCCSDWPFFYDPTVDFSTSGTTLTLTAAVDAPSNNATLLFVYIS